MENNPLRVVRSDDNKARRYRCVSDKMELVEVDLPPHEQVHGHSFQLFCNMMSLAGHELTRKEALLSLITIQEFDVSNDELFSNFWKAVNDPFLPAGKLQFRHVLKHVNDYRKQLFTHKKAKEVFNPAAGSWDDFFRQVGYNANGEVLWIRKN